MGIELKRVLKLQEDLFETNVTRKYLSQYENNNENHFIVQVFRNHSFELVEHTLAAYLDYADLNISFRYTGYDDSFSFVELSPDADAVLIWIDFARYKNIDKQKFIKERISYLSEIYNKRIILATCNNDFIIETNKAIVYDLSNLQKEFGDAFYDKRAEVVTGTAISKKALMKVSEELGLNYFPAVFYPNIKAIVLDLDNTLYKGVLGEDGIDGIQLTDGHRKLQETLVELSCKGVLLSIVSKNVETDVLEMFSKRTDFPLKNIHFVKMCISWEEKAKGICTIADYINISTSDMLFIDDNIGELAHVTNVLPDIKIIHALENAEVTNKILKRYPRLMIKTDAGEGQKRKEDIQANEKRKEMQERYKSNEEYIKELQISLIFSINDHKQVPRIAELSNKTNQFIFNYGRFSENEVEKKMNSKDAMVVAVSLSDVLSDSGLIAVGVCSLKEDYIELEDFFMSCRALGRGIDDVIVLKVISLMEEHFGVSKVKVDFQNGEKNVPAQRFINENLMSVKNEINMFRFDKNLDFININIREDTNER